MKNSGYTTSLLLPFGPNLERRGTNSESQRGGWRLKVLRRVLRQMKEAEEETEREDKKGQATRTLLETWRK